MKLRIKGNSIRLRLTQTEVKNFASSGIVEEITSVGPQQLKYALKSQTQDQPLLASFDNNTLTVFMADNLARAWYDAEDVGYRHLSQTPEGDQLFLLVEKDFVCLDETFEDQSDNYPNPNSTC